MLISHRKKLGITNYTIILSSLLRFREMFPEHNIYKSETAGICRLFCLSIFIWYY